jgi:hypothetical protein
MTKLGGASLFALAMAIAAPCAAAPAPDPAPVSSAAPTEPETARPEAAAVVEIAGLETPLLSDADLAGERGGETLTLTNQTLVAITSGNVLNGDFTAGAVTLSDNALAGFNGVGNLLINTGAQVSLQTGMNLTINLAPSGQ